MDITVLITCYNRESRVGDAIRSALSQTLPPAEILVIDDGSTDDSAAVAAAFGSPVRLIRTPNRGFPSALNTGVAVARGDWIAFLDSDDTWLPEKLALQAEALRRFSEASLVFCDTDVSKDGEVVVPSRFVLGGVYGSEECRESDYALFGREFFRNMIEHSRILTSATMVRRDLPELRFDESFRCCIDWPVWLKMILRYKFAMVDRVLVRMNFDGDNLTSKVSQIQRNAVLVLERHLQDPGLTDSEHDAVALGLSNRRLGAMYHSMIRGESREARRLLAAIPAESLGRARWMAYYLVNSLPPNFVRSLARLRLRGHKSSGPHGYLPHT
jgi:glycosyltransferase involved in cell wall biosynthesis